MIDDSVIYAFATACGEFEAPFALADKLPDDFVGLCVDQFLNERQYDVYCAENYFIHRYLSCICCIIRAWARIEKLPHNECDNPVDYDDILIDLDAADEDVQRGLLAFEEQQYSYDDIWYVQNVMQNISDKLATALYGCGGLESWGTRQMLQVYSLAEEPTANTESSDTSTVSLELSSETRNVVSTLSSDWDSSYSVTPTEAFESYTEDTQLDADALFIEDFAAKHDVPLYNSVSVFDGVEKLPAQELVYPEPLPRQIL